LLCSALVFCVQVADSSGKVCTQEHQEKPAQFCSRFHTVQPSYNHDRGLAKNDMSLSI